MDVKTQIHFLLQSQKNQFIKYVLIGGLSASLDFLFFNLFVHVIAMDYLIANIFSVNIGILNSFILNRKFNFKVLDKKIRRLSIFYTIGFSGLLLSSILLWFFVETMHIDKTIVKLITIPIIVIFQFTMNKVITFKTHN